MLSSFLHLYGVLTLDLKCSHSYLKYKLAENSFCPEKARVGVFGSMIFMRVH